MKHLLQLGLLMIFFFNNNNSLSQTIEFNYDESGNSVSRTLITDQLKSSRIEFPVTDNNNLYTLEDNTDLISAEGQINTLIYPNQTLMYKLSNCIPEKFSINLSQGSEVYDSFYYKQIKAYCIRTEKFGIGNNNKRSNIIFSFKEKREIIFMFYNQNIFVFYSFDNLPLDKTNFTEIMN